MPSQGVAATIKHMDTLRESKWGLVIYRCTYSDDGLWNSLLQKMRDATAENFEDEGPQGATLLSRLEWSVMEDRSRFENASKHTIRQAFQEWVDQATKESEGPGARLEPRTSPSPRYRYCLQVDEAALRSVVGEDSNEEPYIHLIKRRWPNRSFLSQDVLRRLEEDEAMLREGEDDDDELSDIEGCIDQDVGFMKLDPYLVYPGAYNYLDNGSDWHLLYVRPPAIGPI